MRNIVIVLATVMLLGAFLTAACADPAVDAAQSKFSGARSAYIKAKEELQDARIDSLITFGKPEKKQAVERIRRAREALKQAERTYKKALHELHMAEMARDAKRDRSPWK